MNGCPVDSQSRDRVARRQLSAEQADGGIVAASSNEFALVFGENATSTAQSLSQNRFRRAGFASSLYTREAFGAVRIGTINYNLYRRNESGGSVGDACRPFRHGCPRAQPAKPVLSFSDILFLPVDKTCFFRFVMVEC